MADLVQLARPPAGGPGNTGAAPRARSRSPRVVFEDTDIESPEQATVAFAPDQALVFIRPRVYGQPAFTSSLINHGPGAISVRWDGVNTTYGDPAAILITAGMGYAELVAVRLAIAADPSGATVSMTCESWHG